MQAGDAPRLERRRGQVEAARRAARAERSRQRGAERALAPPAAAGRRRRLQATSKMTDAEIASELEKF